MKEFNGLLYRDYKIPDNFKRVVVGFDSFTYPCFLGIEFSDKQGTKLLSKGTIMNPIETILDDDERIVGIASRNEDYAIHTDF